MSVTGPEAEQGLMEGVPSPRMYWDEPHGPLNEGLVNGNASAPSNSMDNLLN